MLMRTTLVSLLAGAAMLVGNAAFAGPKTVSGPGVESQCFKPWTPTTRVLQWEKKAGPYRVAIVNGYIGNTWRKQMIKTAKAFADQPDIKAQIKDLKIVSTGTDLAAQIKAIEDAIAAGYDAVIINAVSPQGFDSVISLADQNNVVLVPFDNTLDTDRVMMVNEDQTQFGVLPAEFLIRTLGRTSGKILEVRGLPGNSVDRDQHLGFRKVMDAPGHSFQIVEVVGNWDDATVEKVTADAIATHGRFDGIFVQAGSTGVVRAMMKAGHPFVPVSGESENGFRKMIAAHAKDGLKGLSLGQSPGLVAIAMKAALSALQGNPMPQMISVPIPSADDTTLKDGVNYWSNLTDDFYTTNEVLPCGVNIPATAILAKDDANSN